MSMMDMVTAGEFEGGVRGRRAGLDGPVYLLLGEAQLARHKGVREIDARRACPFPTGRLCEPFSTSS